MRISSEILFAAVEEQLAAGRSASFTVTGMSMWPFLCHGRDRVIVTGCSPDDLAVGDIDRGRQLLPGRVDFQRVYPGKGHGYRTKRKDHILQEPLLAFHIRCLADSLSLQGNASPMGQSVQQRKMPETVRTSEPERTFPAFFSQ